MAIEPGEFGVLRLHLPRRDVLFPLWPGVSLLGKRQLLGFLAYDLVLIGPFLQHFSTVRPEMRLSLILYTFVVCYSGLLAIYFLFIHPPTRRRFTSVEKF